MTTLLTGFEPFGGSPVNASGQVVAAIAATGMPQVATAILPTSYRRAELQLAELLQQHQPDHVLLLGLAQREQVLRFEQVALNLDDAESPDNDGDVRQRARIVEDGPVGYWATLPLDDMAEQARLFGETPRFSHDAGGFVCNHIFFTAMHRLASRGPASRCGFVHLPPLATGDRLVRVVGLVRTWVGQLAAALPESVPR